MSADLFAEFNDHSNSTSVPTQPSDASGHPGKSQAQSRDNSSDPFDFALGGHASLEAQKKTAAWPPCPSFSNASANTGGRPGQPNPVSPSPVVAVPQPEEDDGWGDFEVAEHGTASTTLPSDTLVGLKSPADWGFGAATLDRPQSSRYLAPDPVTDGSAGTLLDLEPSSATKYSDPQRSWPRPEVKRSFKTKTIPSDANVLFDADDFELQDGGGLHDDEFDEFGDFEAVDTANQHDIVASAALNIESTLDLLGLDQDATVGHGQREIEKESREPPKPFKFGAMSSDQSRSFGERSHQNLDQVHRPRAVANLVAKAASANRSKPVSVSASASHSLARAARTSHAVAVADQGDEWAAWDDFSTGKGDEENPQGALQTSGGVETTVDHAGRTGKDTPSGPVKTTDTAGPPINVPPPAILLSVFPGLFSGGGALFKPISGQSGSIKHQVLSNPKTVEFLKGFVLLAATAARIMAGRKNRWHRDKLLAKSMSISAAGSKGMKLAGIDKTQSAREDREAADVIAAWKEQVGRLRSAVSAANSTGKAELRVPELTENPRVETAKTVPTASKACVICGLKREERVVKVDFDVEDSFGEWWTDHWGHRACKNFWLEHEQRLRQR